MIVTIAMLIYILLLLLTAWYMWHRRNGTFIIFDIGGNPELATILKWTAIALLCESVLGAVLLFLGNKYLNLITISLSCITLLIFSLLFNQKNL
ncbi:hypothetical protein [Lactobacillus kalixensis]|nr:hypothetical protein [Lactobacillus kalixensis]